MIRPSVLLVDDDRDGVDRLRGFLVDFGFDVRMANESEEIHALLSSHRPDLVVMDLVLSKANGMTLMQQIRRETNIPVVVLSRRIEPADRIIGLELGADDYVCKPCEPRELLARMRAILRRVPDRAACPMSPPRGITVGRWELRRDERRLVAASGGGNVSLSASEYRLLMAFLSAPRVVLSREHLMSSARGREMRVADRGIDLLVSRLRRKLEDDTAATPLIRTVRGRGYIYEAPASVGGSGAVDWMARPLPPIETMAPYPGLSAGRSGERATRVFA
ncbi:response regulator transcription factor [Xylophilus sp. GOD-11R]|uniref:response regulator transcription factor n=1 Tax=Xylophilus sp. GOD-11R TaxID=3089814 RepID=UPI00298C5335|nr:response regulator transcription factor [Xylophilus sp. GOD-11R]WPB57538.1 response regulator transcription factor [Xylophilus sp. GOD-11R]